MNRSVNRSLRHARRPFRPRAKITGPRLLPFGGVLGLAVGAASLAAASIGVLAIGRLAIGQMAIGRLRMKSLEVDELTVRRLRVLEHDQPKT